MPGEITFRTISLHLVQIDRDGRCLGSLQSHPGQAGRWDLIAGDGEILASGQLQAMKRKAVELWCKCGECKPVEASS